jgi:hypothetical protein
MSDERQSTVHACIRKELVDPPESAAASAPWHSIAFALNEGPRTTTPDDILYFDAGVIVAAAVGRKRWPSRKFGDDTNSRRHHHPGDARP